MVEEDVVDGRLVEILTLGRRVLELAAAAAEAMDERHGARDVVGGRPAPSRRDGSCI